MLAGSPGKRIITGLIPPDSLKIFFQPIDFKDLTSNSFECNILAEFSRICIMQALDSMGFMSCAPKKI
jgi:hypothetical protein